MKRELLILILLLINVLAFGKASFTLNGTIKNFTGEKISLSVSTNYISGDEKHECLVNKNGEFKFELDIEGSNTARLITGKHNIALFITKGDDISCTFDYDRIVETMHFSGNKASHYNYFIDYYRKFKLPHAMFTKPDFSDIFNMSPNKFKSYRKSKVETDLLFLEEYASVNKITNDFKQYCETEIKYSFYYALASYSSLREYFKNISDTIPEDFYKELRSDLFNNDDYLISESYCNAMLTYVSKLKSGDYEEPVSFYNKAFGFSIQEFNHKSLDFCKARLIADVLRSDAPTAFKDSLAINYSTTGKYPDYMASVAAIYSESLYSREKRIPEEALNSKIVTIDGKVLTIGKMLKKFKGKVVYIDIWASFCGPCKIEMAHSEKLMQDFQDKDIVFLYLSIDKDVAAWKNAKNNWGISGENFLLKTGLNSVFAKHFKIHGVPHYILISKNENVVFPSAARPGSASIKSSILTLCKQ